MFKLKIVAFCICAGVAFALSAGTVAAEVCVGEEPTQSVLGEFFYTINPRKLCCGSGTLRALSPVPEPCPELDTYACLSSMIWIAPRYVVCDGASSTLKCVDAFLPIKHTYNATCDTLDCGDGLFPDPRCKFEIQSIDFWLVKLTVDCETGDPAVGDAPLWNDIYYAPAVPPGDCDFPAVLAP